MTFEVTYRDRGGRRLTEAVEAADRDALFKVLDERGIKAIHVTEGVSRRTRRVALSGETAARWGRGALLIAAGVALVGGIGIWWGVGRGGSNASPDAQKSAPPAKDERKPQSPNERKRVSPSIATNAPVALNGNVGGKEPELIHLPHLPKKYKVKSVESCVTNSYGQIITSFTTIDGKTHLSTRRARPPAFSHVTDQLLAMALSPNGAGRIAPMPGLTADADMGKRFIESLKTPIDVSPDDSPALAAKKKAVMEARLEMAEMMKNGMSFEDALGEHQKLVNENAELHGEAMANLRRLCESGASAEDMGEYVKAVNEQLESIGAEPISISALEAELDDDGSEDD